MAVSPAPFDPLAYLCTASGLVSARGLPFLPGGGAAPVTRAALTVDRPPPAVCTSPPTSYQSLPSVGGPGDVKVDFDLGIGPGVGVDNKSLCFKSGALPASPVIRIKQGNRLTVHLTNTLWNTGPDNTENCDIENYVGGPPVSKSCAQPEHGFKAAPGPNGSFYPIQTNVPHLSDGATNLHVHGLEVSPQPCSDNVLQSVLVAANWNGPLPPQLSCQSAPNELTYSYDIDANHPTGLYFYHTHWHGHALAQTMMGASGAIVIEGEDDIRRAKLGIGDDVMIVRDIPSAYVPGESTPLAPPLKLAAASVTTLGAAAKRNWFPTVDPRIDRENIAGCPVDLPDVGGPAVTRLTLNGALVNETAAFPPPDDKVLVKTMAAGERQLWRLVNASAQTYISPRLVLSQNGQTTVLPLQIVALDGAPIRDNDGRHGIDRLDTTKKPLILATANRVEFLVDAPPPGATLYLDSTQVTPGCAADGIPARRLLRVVSTGAAAAPAAPLDEAALVSGAKDPTYADMVDVEPAVKRVFAFMEYPRGFTASKSQWIVGPPGKGQFNPNSTDFYLTMIQSTDGQGQPVTIRPFVPESPPDVVVHLKGKDSVIEEWTVQNYTLEVHPFHMHQMHFRDVTEADALGGRASILDTVNLPPATRTASSSQPGVDIPDLPGEVRLRMKFTRDMVGDFVYHCHILAHEDKGMMQKIRVVAD